MTTTANSVPPIRRLAPILTVPPQLYLMRGSISAQRTSTSVLTKRKNSTITRIEPWTTGMSRRLTLSTSSDPSPGQANSFSTITAWPMTLPNCRPTVVRTMTRALRARCQLHDLALAHALRAGGADEIGIEDLEHGRPGRAGEERQRRDAERDRRQDDVAQAAVAVAEARQPAELQREEIHQEEAEPEFRQRQAGDGADHRQRVDEAAGLQRRHETERHAEHDGEDHRGEAQLQGRPHPVGEHGGHRLAGAEGGAEVEARELEDVVSEAHVKRIAEPELTVHALDDLRVHDVAPVVAEARREGARDDAEQDEDQQRDREDDRNGLQDAPQEESEHRIPGLTPALQADGARRERMDGLAVRPPTSRPARTRRPRGLS